MAEGRNSRGRIPDVRMNVKLFRDSDPLLTQDLIRISKDKRVWRLVNLASIGLVLEQMQALTTPVPRAVLPGPKSRADSAGQGTEDDYVPMLGEEELADLHEGLCAMKAQ